MNNITKILLGGTAIGALASASAMAGVSSTHYATPHVTALHAGNSVLKSRIHDPRKQHLTYTYADSTYIPASDLNVNVQLLSTYWKFNSSDNECTDPKTKVKVTKQATYGTVTTGNFTESFTSCVLVFHGDNYELTNSAGEGKSNSFSSKLKAKFKLSGKKAIGIININNSVSIG